jgi:hypothetical protein
VCRNISSRPESAPWPQVYPEGWNLDRITTEFSPLKKYDAARFLVAEIDGEIKGLIAGHPLKLFLDNEISHLKGRFENEEESYYQRDIILDPTVRGGHLAHALFDELKNFAI